MKSFSALYNVLWLLCTLFYFCTALSTPCDRGQVIVIGAGSSGVSAAHALQLHGCNVTVVEARNRIGGRTFTIASGNLKGMDVGGHWVEAGIDNKVTATLAGLLDVKLLEVGGDNLYQARRSQLTLFSEEEKRILSRGEMDATFDLMSTRKAFLKYYWDDWKAKNPGTDIHIGDGFKHMAKLANYSRYDQRALEWHDAIYDGLYGTSPSKLSMKAAYDFPYTEFYGDELPGYEKHGDCVVIGGYLELWKKMAHEVNIRLNSPVSEVKHSEQGVSVTLANGEVIEGSAVIVTVPLGVLKTDDIKFDPPLSERKQSAINAIGFGHVAKVLLYYDEPFWPQEYYGFGYIARKEEPGYWGWIFNAQFEGQNKTALSWYLVGKNAFEVEDQSYDDILVEVNRVMGEFFVGAKIPEKPVEMYVSQWHNEKYSRGTWSYDPIGTTPMDRTAYAEPASEGNLMFAGEGTCKLMFGNVHGSILSGIREAYRALGNVSSTWPMFDPAIRTLCEEESPTNSAWARTSPRGRKFMPF